MFDKHYQKQQVKITITAENSFIFDNEGFRYLAIRKRHHEIFQEYLPHYQNSWKKSVEESLRFLKYVVTLPPHTVRETTSLNKALQLIQKLPRPVAEVSRLIEENIQLAQQYQHRVEQNPSVLSEGIPQNVAQVRQFTHPRTVCASEKCTRIMHKNEQQRVEYLSICHDNCYLKGVVQERLRHQELRECEVMDPVNGICQKCSCKWSKHIHLTYEYATDRTYLKETVRTRTTRTTIANASSIVDICRLIRDLQQEAQQIHDVYKQLAEFLRANAMFPINDRLIDYLDHMIHI